MSRFAEGTQITPHRGVADSQSIGEIVDRRGGTFHFGLVQETYESMATAVDGRVDEIVVRMLDRPLHHL
jgi:hypothetical protein